MDTRAEKSLRSKKQKNEATNQEFSKRAYYMQRARQYLTSPARLKQLFLKIVMYVFLIGLAFVFIYPFLYMIITSLKSNADLGNFAVKWIPTRLQFENYAIALKFMKYGQYFKNSMTVTILATVGHVIACSFIGYGFARFNFPFKKLLFGCVMLAFIVPIQTIIVPMYLTYTKFGWRNTYLPLIIPTFFGFGLKGGLFVFLFRQFYLTLPRDLENAARIDGCNFLQTYLKIVFPLGQSTMVVATVLSVVWHFNDAYEPSMYIDKAELGFLPSRISYMVGLASAPPETLYETMEILGLDEDTLNDAVIMSSAALICAPIIIFFAFAQRLFMEGIERSGITGE
ncbi:MAG: carbohydrate ABC transporter permease [Lachnospiraceae bacterium]|nr:carbohydrate ABC transporter permease [Lachnospiraceae bacterium]